MDSVKEALIIAYYSHKLHVEDTCNQCFSDAMMKLCDEVFSCLLDVDCSEIIQVIRKSGIAFEISHGDVPQFSYSLDKIHKLGWEAKVSSNEAVRKSIRYILDKDMVAIGK